jgi:hypothetical protein
MSSPFRSASVGLFLLALLPLPTSAAPLQVTGLAPGRNSVAQPTTNVAITFDKAVVSGSITSGTFRVFGRASGPKTGTFTFSNGNQTVTLHPSEPFSAGETVRVNLSHDIQAMDLTFLRTAGYAYQFQVACTPSSGDFQEIDVFSNRINNQQTRIYGAAASDFNEDQWIDLATINEVSADVRVCLNTADGSGLFQPFLPPQTIGVESSPNDPADFNNDGRVDLCVAAYDDDAVWVLLGAGNGTFSTITRYPVGLLARGIAALDVDGDGDADIVNANSGSDFLSMMINDGAGSFAAPTVLEAGVSSEFGLEAADMNNDGITDIVVSGNGSSDLRVLLGNGDATFTPAGPPTSAGGLNWVVVVDDVNGDGNLDAALANSFSNNGAVVLGDGAGGLGAPTLYSMGAHTPSADLGDLDGDGDPDLVLSSYGGGYWRVFKNDGAGVFTFDVEIAAAANPSCAVLLDFDADHDLDMALTDEIADVVMLMRNMGAVGVPEAASGVARWTNEPNPFRGGTTFRFELPVAAVVSIDVFDVAGRFVAEVGPTWRAAGSQQLAFDGRGLRGDPLPSGVYLYRVSAGTDVRVEKMVVAR